MDSEGKAFLLKAIIFYNRYFPCCLSFPQCLALLAQTGSRVVWCAAGTVFSELQLIVSIKTKQNKTENPPQRNSAWEEDQCFQAIEFRKEENKEKNKMMQCFDHILLIGNIKLKASLA